MITYGVSRVGQYHLNEGNNICQDAFKIETIGENIVVAAVADGVGSENHSDIGAKIAVEKCVEYCCEFYQKMDDKELLLSNAFQNALFAIEDESKDSKIPIDQMDCTLCAVIYTKDDVVCGNVGDSGAIGLSKDGEYILLTSQQNSEDGSVYPLMSKNSWKFYTVEMEFVSILLATDGFYNRLFPLYLRADEKKMEFKHQQILDNEMAARFLDVDLNRMLNSEDILPMIDAEIDNIPRDGTWDGIIDDITVVGILSGEDHKRKEEYSTPIDREYLKRISTEIVKQQLYKNNPQNDKKGITGFSVLPELPPLIDTNDVETTESKLNPMELIDSINIPKQLQPYIEWPLEILRNGKGELIFSIPKKLPKHMAIDEFLKDPENNRITRRDNVAYQFSWLLAQCHAEGLFLGIFDRSHIAIGEKREVYFINIEPQTIATKEDLYVSKDVLESIDRGYLNKKIKGNRIKTEDAENSLLSILIYELIFCDSSPYRLKNGHRTYSENMDKTIPDIGQFPEYIIKLLHRSFGDNDFEKMPTAQEWFGAIDRYSNEVVICKNDSTHVYYKEAEACPYCRVISNNGQNRKN